jgi:hypothetical protein
MLWYASSTKNYDKDFFFNAKNVIEVHYLFIETKHLATRHKQHFEIHLKFNPQYDRQMVKT